MALFIRLSNDQFSALKPGGAEKDQTTPRQLGMTEILNTLNTDEIYHRKEFLFSTYIVMAYFRFAIIGADFKPNYKCLFLTYTENTQPGNLESFIVQSVTLQMWISLKTRSL